MTATPMPQPSAARHQARRVPLIEAVANVALGLALALGGPPGLFPVFGIAMTPRQNLGTSLLFTALSLIRSYVLQRLFERLGRHGAGQGPRQHTGPAS